MSKLWSSTPDPFDWAVVGDVLLTRAVAGSISDAQWFGMLDDMRRPEVRAIFSLSFGATGVSAVQRKAAADVMQSKDIPAIVIADSRITRGVLTAVSWLGANIQSFSWSRVDDALARLDTNPELKEELRGIVEDFRAHGPVPRK